MEFKYFEQPEKFTAYTAAKTTCNVCQQTKHCFDAETYYGEDRLSAICPECLASGALRAYDSTTCEGDIEELIRQLQAIHPDLSTDEVASLAQGKTEVLEKTTPHLMSWQDWNWPCADGDYCRFIGYGSKFLYNQLARDKDGARLFRQSLYYTVKDEEDADELWEEYMPAKSIRTYEASLEFDLLFYVFKSLIDQRIITVWDAS